MSLQSDLVIRATQIAFKRTKERGMKEVTLDDLLVGLLKAISRFDIAQIGSWSIDILTLGNSHVGNADEDISPDELKTTYSDRAVRLFDRAAEIASEDNSTFIDIVHFLVAFGDEDEGLMGKLKREYTITSTTWRAALVSWSVQEKRDSVVTSRESDSGKSHGKRNGAKSWMTPDEAADVLGLHTQTLRGYIRSGKLPAHRIAGERAIRIRYADLMQLLEPLDPDM